MKYWKIISRQTLKMKKKKFFNPSVPPSGPAPTDGEYTPKPYVLLCGKI